MRYFIIIFCIAFYSCTPVEEATTATNLFLDEMEIGEIVRFDMSSRGCFHSQAYELAVEKLIHHHEVIFKNKRHKISDSQFELLRKFEIELRSKHGKGCSTKHQYLITNTHTHTIYKNIDESCQWNGFFNLIVSLKLTDWEEFKS